MIERDEDSLGHEPDEALPGERLVDAHLAALIGELMQLVFQRYPDVSGAEHKSLMVGLLDLHRQLRERGGARRRLQ
jgi:hypothetical protein